MLEHLRSFSNCKMWIPFPTIFFFLFPISLSFQHSALSLLSLSPPHCIGGQA
jgi:hypothetical protein